MRKKEILNKKAMPVGPPIQRAGRRGFTFIEILTLLSIISLVITLQMAVVTQAKLKARDAKRLVDVRAINQALEFYNNDLGMYPCEDLDDPSSSMCFVSFAGDPFTQNTKTGAIQWHNGAPPPGYAACCGEEAPEWCDPEDIEKCEDHLSWRYDLLIAFQNYLKIPADPIQFFSDGPLYLLMGPCEENSCCLNCIFMGDEEGEFMFSNIQGLKGKYLLMFTTEGVTDLGPPGVKFMNEKGLLSVSLD